MRTSLEMQSELIKKKLADNVDYDIIHTLYVLCIITALAPI